ncbi:site-specific integrase [Streptomyces sp. NPDC020681]|uniref:site-specific integrase n=1 Tax=Streptomyces sp. NPDC020681 TaxID=3365083 RepID=UPI0037AACD62
MFETGDSERDLVGLVLLENGALVETADPMRPYALLDAECVVVGPVEAFFAELQACSRPATTIRSYGMDLLRWWRFLSGWGLAWGRATRLDARDFARWMQIAPKPARVHWRHRASDEVTPSPAARSERVWLCVTGVNGPP